MTLAVSRPFERVYSSTGCPSGVLPNSIFVTLLVEDLIPASGPSAAGAWGRETPSEPARTTPNATRQRIGLLPSSQIEWAARPEWTIESRRPGHYTWTAPTAATLWRRI